MYDSLFYFSFVGFGFGIFDLILLVYGKNFEGII